MVTLADETSFAAFLGKEDYANAPEFTMDGVYLRGANRLVVFDQRPLGPMPRASRRP